MIKIHKKTKCSDIKISLALFTYKIICIALLLVRKISQVGLPLIIYFTTVSFISYMYYIKNELLQLYSINK